jgi:hypothetical protein
LKVGHFLTIPFRMLRTMEASTATTSARVWKAVEGLGQSIVHAFSEAELDPYTGRAWIQETIPWRRNSTSPSPGLQEPV